MKKLIEGLVSLLKWIGALSVAAMMGLVCLDVVMRAAGRPIKGAVEFVGFLATIALACSLPYTHALRGHVGVDLLVRRLRRRTRNIIDLITSCLTLGLFIVVAWRTMVYASTLRASGEVSMTLEFPAYLFVYFIGFGFAVLCLTVWLDIVRSWREAAEK